MPRLPFQSPVYRSTARLVRPRVGFVDGHYIVNPTQTQLAESRLDLVVAGTAHAVLMVESEADLLTEDEMLGAVTFGHEQMQVAIKAIEELAAEAGKPKWDWQAPAKPEGLADKVAEHAKAGLQTAYTHTDKTARREAISQVRQQLIETLCPEGDDNAPAVDDVKEAFSAMEKHFVRDRILSGNPRIDGRDLTTVRPLDMQLGVFPRTHGSAVFTRGVKPRRWSWPRSAPAVTPRSSMRRKASRKSSSCCTTTSPPFCVGETSFMLGPKRRENRPRPFGQARDDGGGSEGRGIPLCVAPGVGKLPSPTVQARWQRSAAVHWR